MIYTVTFNPSIDYVVQLDNLIAGSINRTKSEEVYFGGKGINVSLMLNKLGIPSVAMGFSAGFTGDAIVNSLKKENITADFIRLPEGCSRINIKIKSAEETAINAQGPHIPKTALSMLIDKLKQLASKDILVLSGSIPSALPEDTYEKILCELANKGIYFVIDATGKLLENSLKYKPFLIKPNKEELEEIFKTKFNCIEDTILHAKLLHDKGAKNVLVSLAGEGAVLIDNSGSTHKIGVPSGELKNSVGAGDSMVAGFLAGYMEKSDPEYALKLGTACGSATAFSYGLGEKSLIMQLLNTL